MGVAVAVGAGIFSIGAQAAAFHAGPAVIISFLIAGVVCGAAVMCYAEFASMIPVAGSAYTFTYTTVGEIVARVIGWDLILEMLMAGSVVSKYWGVYLNDFFRLVGWNINTNVTIGSFNFDFAPIIVVAFFTALLVCGTKIGARVDGALTILKIAIVLFVVIVGFFYVKAENFTPFIPPSEPATATGSGLAATMEQPLWQWATGMTPSIYGIAGIISGAALVFFAFLGFDAPAGYPAFHKAYAPVVLDTGLDVADLQEFHGLIDEFGKAYRGDAAKNESFLQSWRPGEAAPRPTE